MDINRCLACGLAYFFCLIFSQIAHAEITKPVSGKYWKIDSYSGYDCFSFEQKCSFSQAFAAFNQNPSSCKAGTIEWTGISSAPGTCTYRASYTCTSRNSGSKITGSPNIYCGGENLEEENCGPSFIWNEALGRCTWDCAGDKGKYVGGEFSPVTSVARKQFFEGSSASDNMTYCDSETSCQYELKLDFKASNGAGTPWWGTGVGQLTGNYCNPGSSDPETLPLEEKKEDQSCESQGLSTAQINGTDVCVVSSTETTTKTETKKNEDGSREETTIKEEKNRETGETTTTTTTNTYDSNGNLVSSSTTQTTKKGYGQGEGEGYGTKWGGGCDNGYTCEGDPIQCAIAKAEWERVCALRVSDDVKAAGEAALGQGGSGGYGEGDPRNPDNIEEVDVQTWQTSSGMSSAGLQDFKFSFRGKQIVIPFSNWNIYIDYPMP